MLKVFLLLLCAAATAAEFNVSDIIGKNPVPICATLVKSHGIPCEEHQVTTEDGFKLSMIRLPNNAKGKSVLMMHGLLASATSFLVATEPGQGSGRTAALKLWTAGFDVWLGNNRGTWYSLQNKKWSPTGEEFWEHVDFDFMGQYDVPAMVNYITKVAKRKQISYLGYSQGSTQAFAGFSQSRALRKKINLFVAMAPAARLAHLSSPLLLGLAGLPQTALFNLFGTTSFPPLNLTALEIMAKVNVKCACNHRLLCQNLLYDIGGATPDGVDPAVWKNLLTFDPDGTSMRNLAHWFQLITTGKFQKFDYGVWGNLFFYGRKTPPQYNLKKVKVPTLIMYGGKDDLATPEDVEWLMSKLPSYRAIKFPDYAHMDFTWAEDSPQTVWNKVQHALETVTENDLEANEPDTDEE